ncbi:MAG TPA: hypothetical protein VLD84_00950 [Nitrososphaeraceae archaeon]|nr:hypothetical protein [Nitrososphaeraceae archaeon]
MKIQTSNQPFIGSPIEKIIISSGIMIFLFLVGMPLDSDIFAIENSTFILSNLTYDSINPEISVSGDDIYTSWISNVDSNNSDVMFSYISNAAVLPTNISNVSNTPGISNIIKLKSSKNNVYITWEDKQPDKWHLLFRKSQDGGETFSNLRDLSNTTGNVHLHDLSTSGNNVFVVWAANENVSSTNKDIFFRRSANFGNSFDQTINLSNNTDDSLDPHMITNQNGTIIYIVWTQCDIKHDDPMCSIIFTKSLNKGESFSGPITLSNVMMSSENRSTINYSLNHATAINKLNEPYSNTSLISSINEASNSINPNIFTTPDGRQIYVMWEQVMSAKGNSEIFLTSSVDFGSSFNQVINVSNTPGISRLACAQLLGNDIYVTWSDTINHSRTFDIMLTKIDRRGTTNFVRNLSNNSGNSVSPNLLATDDKLFVTWSDNTSNPSIRLWSADALRSYGMEEMLNKHQEGDYLNPVIFEARNKLWIVWTQDIIDRHEIVLFSKDI